MGTILIGGFVVSSVVGFLARLVWPGKQRISAKSEVALVVAVAFAGAVLGAVVAEIFDVRETSGIDWIKLGLQAVFAVLSVVGYLKIRTPGTPV